MKGSDFVMELNPPEDMEKTLVIARDAHPCMWTITDDGYLAGLVAGDMGYATTDFRLDKETREIWEAGVKAMRDQKRKN